MTFYITCKTNNHSDVLHAIGFSSLVESVTDEDPEIKYHGSHFTINIDSSLNNLDLSEIHPDYTYVTNNVSNENSEFIENLDPDDKLVISDEYDKLAQLRSQETDKLDSEVRESIQDQIDSNLTLHSMIHSRPPWDKDAELFVKLMKNKNKLQEIIPNYLEEYSTFQKFLPKDIPEEEEIFDDTFSSSLIYNPQFSKGANRTKATSVSVGSLYDSYTSWFEEWMKYRGLEKSVIGSEASGYRRIYVLTPKKIQLGLLKRIRENLNNNTPTYNETVKLDIRVILELTKLIVQKSEYMDEEENFFGRSMKTPSEVIEGIQVSIYKDMGNVYSPFKYFVMSTPEWFDINSKDDAIAFIQICQEFLDILQGLREDRSEQMELLLRYRDFLTSNVPEDLLDFQSKYASFLMRETGRRGSAPKRFFSHILDKLFTRGFGMSYTTIVQDDGFQNIATAIRKATINGQIMKAIQGNSKYSIQYGLSQDWRKSVKIKDKFVSKLSDFVHTYNRETTRKMEQNSDSEKGFRKMITTDDLDSVINLIDEFGSEQVGMLLLAYGYSREEREEEEEDE